MLLFIQQRGIANVNGYAIIYEFDGKKKVDFLESRFITTKVLRDLRPFTNYTIWIRPRCEMGFALCTEVPVTFMTRGDRKCLTHYLPSTVVQEKFDIKNISSDTLVDEILIHDLFFRTREYFQLSSMCW